MITTVNNQTSPENFALRQGLRYFAVSKSKLIVMSIFTFGIYHYYWFYKNWELISINTQRNINPACRALFAFFFVHKLFRNIKESAGSNGIGSSWRPDTLAWSFILLTITGQLAYPFCLIGLLSFVPLIFVQSTVNELNVKFAPIADKNEKFSGPDIAIIVIGSLFLVLSILGSFLAQMKS